MIRRLKRNRKLLALLILILLVLAAVITVTAVRNQGKRSLTDGNYACGIGYEGLRVKRVIQYFDLKNTTGMGGAYYNENVAAAVSRFQQEHHLKATGEVDFQTWQAMGFDREEWDRCGTYRSPAKVSGSASRQEKIEAMIERACEYLGDPYVIGASGPCGEEYGLDCSGLVMQALYAAGVALPDINPVTHAHPGHEYESRNLWNSDYFTVVDFDERERGDLIFYSNSEGIVIHIAIYLGDDQVIESWPNDVQISPVIDERHPEIKGVKRVF